MLRLRTGSVGLLVALLGAALPACYSPELADGALKCSAGNACPSGYTCVVDGSCWHSGRAPHKPSAPQSVEATPTLDGNIIVIWQLPSDQGGTLLTGFTVVASPGGATTTTAGDTLVTFGGLSNTEQYTFTVVATNAAGDSVPSAPSAPVQLPTLPGAPQNVTATAWPSTATVRWAAPTSTGGLAISNYFVSSTPGGASAQVAGDQLSASLFFLTNGTAYTFTVTAKNALGAGPTSTPSGSVTPATVPQAPVITQVAAGTGSAQVTWVAAPDGGSAITAFELEESIDSAAYAAVTSTLATSVQITGLNAGSSARFHVRAINAVGPSAWSSQSSAVTIR